MDKHCNHNIPETKKGAGPCDIKWEVKKRNGAKQWWCRTHGYEASAPDGAALPQCSAAWFDPPSDDMQVDIDLADGEVSVWGAIDAAIKIGPVPPEPGGVHVHRRPGPDASKDTDRSYDIVRVHRGDHTETIETMAARAYSISELTGVEVMPLTCPHCGEIHIDELMFATRGHTKHLCNSCGRNFRYPTPSVSNPLGQAQQRLGLPPAPKPEAIDRALNLVSGDYSAIALWPSNAAIISTTTRPEEAGVHVHAWGHDGDLVIDETHSPVTLDGEQIDETALRWLAVQRAVAEGAPIISVACSACGHSILSPTTDWIEPKTHHQCDACGAENRTTRKTFLNPLADKAS